MRKVCRLTSLLLVLMFALVAVAATPTGSVQLYCNGNPFGQPTALNADGTYTATSTFLPVGSDVITATYTSDAGLNPSTSPPITEVITVPNLDTTTTLVVSPNPQVQGGPVTFSGTVSNSTSSPAHKTPAKK